MLHISIIAVGRLKERFWVQACDEYLKRLGPYACMRMIELPDSDPSKAGGADRSVEQEGCRILNAIPSHSCAILLDISGNPISSAGIAESLDELAVNGRNDICFIIGGPCGVGEEVKKRADLRWSFGAITLPHNIARVVLLEQIYRAFKISRGEPYHK